MPKKRVKKGGGGKQGGLTEEERLLYTKQRAQAEEEMAKRKEEMLTQFLKDKLQKEEKNSAVNLHKLTQQWRTVLRQTRAAELRKDISVSMQTFERMLDHKNSVIKCLVSDLHEAEQQSAQALRSHLCFVESLQALQADRLASHEEQWNDGQQELSSEFNSEREKLLSLHQQEFVYLEDVTFAMEQRYSEVVGEARQDYQSTRDEIKNRHIKEKHDLRNQLEGSVKTLWCQYQQAQQSYKEATEDRRIAYESLRARDECSAQEIESQANTLQKMQDSITSLRASLTCNQRESEAAARELRAAREKVTLQIRQLKAQMSRAHASEKSRLTDLVIHSNAAAKKLQDIVAKGEKLLRRAEMCSKLESEREKVLPFYMSSLTREEVDQVTVQAMDPPEEELAKAMTDYWDLERFWQRYNKVLLERLSLEKEESVLMQENQQLQALLRQYLDGISVSDNTLRQRNPLLMVSQHTLAVPAIADRQRKQHTVIEAAHVVQHTL